MKPFAFAAASLGVVLLGLVSVVPARAGGLLGTLYDTCLGTLGEPVNYAHLPTPVPGAEVYAFRQRGWIITVFFWKHQAHLVVYEKQASANILPAETEVLLRAYGDALPWTWQDNGRCLRRDGRAQARVGSGQVAIYSSEFGAANALFPR